MDWISPPQRRFIRSSPAFFGELSRGRLLHSARCGAARFFGDPRRADHEGPPTTALRLEAIRDLIERRSPAAHAKERFLNPHNTVVRRALPAIRSCRFEARSAASAAPPPRAELQGENSGCAASGLAAGRGRPRAGARLDRCGAATGRAGGAFRAEGTKSAQLDAAHGRRAGFPPTCQSRWTPTYLRPAPDADRSANGVQRDGWRWPALRPVTSTGAVRSGPAQVGTGGRLTPPRHSDSLF